jgi:hypothetical protein
MFYNEIVHHRLFSHAVIICGGGQEGTRGRGRNDSNNVCTYEYMNKEKNKLISQPVQIKVMGMELYICYMQIEIY